MAGVALIQKEKLLAAAVACSPSAPRSKIDTCQITGTGLTANDAATFDDTKYPTEAAIPMYFIATATGVDSLKSHIVAASADGDAAWNNIVFPASGSWTLKIRDARDDSQIATTGVTVS